MTISKQELLKLGARVRLEEINKERDMLLDLLGYDADLAQTIISEQAKGKTPKKVRGGGKYGKHRPHWTQTPAGRKKLAANGKKMWAAKRASEAS